MRGFARSCARAALVGASALGLAALCGRVHATTIELHAYLQEGDSADLTVLVDGKSRCTIKVASATERFDKTPVCRFEWPTNAASLAIRGEYGRKSHASSAKGEQTWRIVDFAPAGARLAETGTSYGERIVAFIAATSAFAKQHVGARADIGAAAPVDQAAVAAAEKRLGFALPADFASMQKTVGALRIGDHSVTEIGELRDAYTELLKGWDTPEADLQKMYSESKRATLKASTLLFTEVGDGLGGLFYQPPPNKACGALGFYFWMSQEGGTDRLKNADGSCMDFAAAFRWVLDGFVIEEFADAVGEKEPSLLIDSSLRIQSLALRFDRDRFGADLSGIWGGPNGFWREPGRD